MVIPSIPPLPDKKKYCASVSGLHDAMPNHQMKQQFFCLNHKDFKAGLDLPNSDLEIEISTYTK